MEKHTFDALEEDVYLAAERVPSGIYQEIESLRQVILQEDGFLPASLNGRVACYQRTRLLSPCQKRLKTENQFAGQSFCAV